MLILKYNVGLHRSSGGTTRKKLKEVLQPDNTFARELLSALRSGWSCNLLAFLSAFPLTFHRPPMARRAEDEGFSDDEDAPHPANKAIASGVRENTGLGVEIVEEGGEIAPTTAIDKLNKLQSDANACLKRLDKISRNLKLQADGKLPGSQVRATTYPSSVYERMASLGDIDAQIEFAR